MQISQTGLDLVKHFEGLFLKAYIDPVGIPTIGYGHTDPDVAFIGNEITADQAEDLLRQDMATAEDAVIRHVDVALNQHEFDALVSFTFNVGAGAFFRSTLCRKLNDGDKDGAADEFLRWNKGTVNGQKVVLAGLTRRRKAERHLFKHGALNFFDGHGVVDPDADEDIATSFAPTPIPAMTVQDPALAFADHIRSWNLRFFTASELLEMGASNGNSQSPAFGLNTLPPREKWDNIRTTAEMLDDLRALLDRPIFINSGFRSEAYNAAIGGAVHSQHKAFKALDFQVGGTMTGPAHWAAILRDFRSSGKFKGGIGVYSTFVHIDTRGHNADF